MYKKKKTCDAFRRVKIGNIAFLFPQYAFTRVEGFVLFYFITKKRVFLIFWFSKKKSLDIFIVYLPFTLAPTPPVS